MSLFPASGVYIDQIAEKDATSFKLCLVNYIKANESKHNLV